MHTKPVVKLAAALMALAIGQAHALDAQCPGGVADGSLDAASRPDENLQCRFIGRIFCFVEQYRNGGLKASDAVAHTVDNLKKVGRTGSHLSNDFTPLVVSAADSLYRRDQTTPWTAYYQAVYACGLDLRVTDEAARRKLGPAWDRAAQACEKQFPGTGTGYPNDGLRDCLEKAMNDLVARK